MLLFETETAWLLLRTDIPQPLGEFDFQVQRPKLYAGGSLQVIEAQKP